MCHIITYQIKLCKSCFIGCHMTKSQEQDSESKFIVTYCMYKMLMRYSSIIYNYINTKKTNIISIQSSQFIIYLRWGCAGWIEKAQIINSSALNGYDWLNRYVSFKNPVWYLQPGSWEQLTNAIESQPTQINK